MKTLSFLKKSVYSALVFFGTLIILSAVYATYQYILSSEYTSGQPLTQSLFGKVVSNISDHETRINTLATSVVPTGAIMSFYLSSCPTWWKSADWTNSTPDLRWAFIRWMNWDLNSRDIVRTLWSYQEDELKQHNHVMKWWNNPSNNTDTSNFAWAYNSWDPLKYKNTQNTWWTETRPKNVALLYCVKE